jgi:hypothetical protein
MSNTNYEVVVSKGWNRKIILTGSMEECVRCAMQYVSVYGGRYISLNEWQLREGGLVWVNRCGNSRI